MRPLASPCFIHCPLNSKAALPLNYEGICSHDDDDDDDDDGDGDGDDDDESIHRPHHILPLKDMKKSSNA